MNLVMKNEIIDWRIVDLEYVTAWKQEDKIDVVM